MVTLLLAWALLAPVASTATEQPPADGKALYLRHCAGCHGTEGRGDGPDAAIFSQPPRNLRDGVLDRYSNEELVRRLLRGTPLRIALDPARMADREKESDALVAHLETLPKVDWDRALRGWDVYADRCASCHGPYGNPPASPPAGVRPPRNLAGDEFRNNVTDAELATAVRHGQRHMPALTPRVGDDEARALQVFVRLLSPGLESYSRYCAGCHGVDGRGVRGTLGDPTELPTTVFDARYFEEHSPRHIRERLWHMLAVQKPAMPHFRSAFGEAEAGAIFDWQRAAWKVPAPLPTP